MIPDIPIIGQAKVNDFFFTVSLTCSCGKTVLLHGQPGAAAACACRKAYAIAGFPSVTPDGQLHFPIASGPAPIGL